MSDPEMLCTAIRGADLEPLQISRQPARSRLARLVNSRSCLDFAQLGPAMLFSGVMPRDCYTLIFVAACPTEGHSFNFGVRHTDGYIAFFAPGGLLDARTPAGYGNATLTVPVPQFHAALARAFPDIPDHLLANGAGMRVGTAEQARLRSVLAMCEELIWQYPDDLASPLVRRHLESELLEVFFAALRSGCQHLLPAPSLRAARRCGRLRQARDFLAEHAQEPIGLDDLSAVLGLSHRGVEGLFKDLAGVTPGVYLRHQRLHQARRALRQAQPVSGMVKQIALGCGFWHLGRFARDYRQLFGESPHQTLAGGLRAAFAAV